MTPETPFSAPSPSMNKRRCSNDEAVRKERIVRNVTWGLWLLVAFQLFSMSVQPFLASAFEGKLVFNHWDFDVYRAAHDAYRTGNNPLDLKALERFGVGIPYNYSPAFTRATMWAFDGPREAVELRFIAAKLIAILLGMFTLIRGLKLKGMLIPIAAFLTVFGFGSGLLVDMAAGNITAFEYLWIALLTVGAYRRWDAMFLAGLFLLCLGKPIWGIFAAVPVLFWWDRRAWRSFALGVGAFALPLVLSVLISRADTVLYLKESFGFRENGWINPCLREFLADVMPHLGVGGKSTTLAWLLCVGGLSWWTVIVRSRLGASATGLAFGGSSLLLLPCILPRYKPYAFGLLVPFLLVALISVHRNRRDFARILLLAAAPFLTILNMTFIAAFDVYGFGLMRVVGYFQLPLILATYAVLNASLLLPAVSRFLKRLRPNPIARAALVGAVLLLTLVAMVKGSRVLARMTSSADISHSTDWETYTRVAALTRQGQVPFRDFVFEYPPTAAFYFAGPAPGPTFTKLDYMRRFVNRTGILLAVLLLGYAWFGVRRGGLLRGLAFTLVTTFLLGVSRELSFMRFDAPVAILATLGTMFALHSRDGNLPELATSKERLAPGVGGFLMGLATGLKMYPAILLVTAYRGLRRGRAAYLAGTTVGLVPTVVLLLIGAKGIGDFLAYHTGRHVELGSLWSSLARRLFSWHMEVAYGAAECRFGPEGLVIAIASLLTLVATVLPLLWLRRSVTPIQALRIGIVALYGFVVFNKVGSPQYALWLLGATLAGVGDAPRRAWITLGAAAAGVLTAADVINNYNVSKDLPVVTAFVDLKNVVLIAGYAVAIWAMRDAFAPARPSEKPAPPSKDESEPCSLPTPV